MDLTPYLETLRADLAAAAAPGGPDITRAADLLGAALEPSVRLALLEAFADAAAEITTRLHGPVVDVRLRGREADFVVSEPAGSPAPPPGDPPPAPAPEGGDVARLTLRMPESLKARAEQAAAAEGISVNAWLVRAVAAAALPGPAGAQRGTRSDGRRLTGYAQA